MTDIERLKEIAQEKNAQWLGLSNIKAINNVIAELEKCKNNIQFNGNIGDISAMLTSAERYALGRKTYMTQWTCQVIGNNLHLVTENDKYVMIRDIENADDYGHECDEKEWKALLSKLNQSISTGLEG